MFGFVSSNVLRDEVEKWKTRSNHFERELEYKHNQYLDIRDEHRKLRSDYDRLKKEHDELVRRLVDALGSTEYGLCFSEYAERRMVERGVVFTASTS